MHLRRDPARGTQAVQPDEAGGVILVVGFGRVGFHRGGWASIQTVAENPSHRGARGNFNTVLHRTVKDEVATDGNTSQAR